MIANGGTINCIGKFHKITLTIGDYVLNNPMIFITMWGTIIVLGSNGYNNWEWRILIFMNFSLDGGELELRGITVKPSKVIISNGMKKLLKKGHQGIITQL